MEVDAYGSEVPLMDVAPALLASADWWFGVSWFGLICSGVITALAALATVGFLLVQFWAGGIRDRHSEWRTRNLETETTLAKQDAANAKDRIRHLDHAVEEARASAATASSKADEVNSTRKGLEQSFAPRGVKSSQADVLIASLRPYSGTEIAVYLGSETPEALQISKFLQGILMAAQWKVLFWTWSGRPGIEGISVVTRMSANSHSVFAADNLNLALTHAGLKSARSIWQGDWTQTGGALAGPDINNGAPFDYADIRLIIGVKEQM